MGLRRIQTGKDGLDAVWPSHLEIGPTHVQMGEKWLRSYTVVGYPREVQPGWFEPLLNFVHPMTMVLSSAPVDPGTLIKTMNRRIIWHRGSVEADRAQGRLGRAEQKVALEDAEVVRVGIARGETRLLEVGLTLTLWASSREELEQHSRLLENLAQSMLVVVRPLRYQQDIGLKRLMPLGTVADKVREMDSRAWATLFPFSSRDVIHPHGQVFGINPNSRSLVIVDRFQMASPHSITIGWSGAGKSFAAKLEAMRARYRGWSVTVVDPEGEYRWLSTIGARVWAVGDLPSVGPSFPFDPFTVMAGSAAEEVDRQADFLMRLLGRMARELVEEFGGLISDALWRVIRKGKNRFSLERTHLLDGPALIAAVGEESGRARNRLEMVYQRWQLCMGGDHPQGLSSFEVFDLSRLTEGMKGASYLALTEWIMRRMGHDVRRLVIFDEAWHLLTDEATAPYLEELFRRARKWGTAISLLSQDISDFTRSRAAEVCLRNAPMVFLLRQHPESIAEVAQLLRLHAGEVQTIESSAPGEGLLLVADDHVPVRVLASPLEQKLLSAKESEVGAT